MNKNDFDLELFIKSLTDAGASITKGSGRLIVDGEETDFVSALRKGFSDYLPIGHKTNTASVSYSSEKEYRSYGYSIKQMDAA